MYSQLTFIILWWTIAEGHFQGLPINFCVHILQGSVVTQTVLGELTINNLYPPVTNILLCITYHNYESWLTVDSCCNNQTAYFLSHPVDEALVTQE